MKRTGLAGHNRWTPHMNVTYPTTSRQTSLQPVGRSLYSPLASFPTACFILALLTDLAYWKTASVAWETFSVWLLALGLVVAGLAVLGGVVDAVRSRSHRGLGQSWPVVICQFVAACLALVNVFVHSRDGYTAVVPQGLVLSALTVVVLLLGVVLARSRAVRAYEVDRSHVEGIV